MDSRTCDSLALHKLVRFVSCLRHALTSSTEVLSTTLLLCIARSGSGGHAFYGLSAPQRIIRIRSEGLYSTFCIALKTKLMNANSPDSSRRA